MVAYGCSGTFGRASNPIIRVLALINQSKIPEKSIKKAIPSDNPYTEIW
jgi:hypothetical protein